MAELLQSLLSSVDLAGMGIGMEQVNIHLGTLPLGCD